jgi:hypothetical protein
MQELKWDKLMSLMELLQALVEAASFVYEQS